MTATMPGSLSLFVQAPGRQRRPPAGVDAVLQVEDAGGGPGLTLHHNLGELASPPPESSPNVQSLLLAAAGAWAADKYAPRAATADAWTRTFTLHLPVNAAVLPLLPRLAHVLHLLTGDLWNLIGRESPVAWGWSGAGQGSWRPTAVVLFSGGLDSLAGALDLLEGGGRLLLVSHHDFGQLAGLQQDLARELAAHYGPEAVRHLGLRVQFPATRELSLRSRSLLYLTLGLAAAAGVGPDKPLIIPENGWISLNPPLTGNRLGTLSTRTTHPAILEEVRDLWREAGLACSLENPYQALTKGEVLAGSANPALLRRLAPATVSCARPVAARWLKQPAGHCGYCYPCLVRRAAMHRVGWDEAQAYRVDAAGDPEVLRHRTRGQDLRAVLVALDTWQHAPAELEARLWLGDDPAPAPERLAWARRLLTAGCAELGQWLREKGGPGIAASLE